MTTKFYCGLIMTTAIVLLSWAGNGVAQGQKTRPAVNAGATASQQPLYNSYRGVQLGMSDQEARTKLGEPASKIDDQDYFMISDKEAAQIRYDKARKVVTISVDYMGGAGAPDNKSVVGEDLETRPNGSLYKMVWYTNQGFWVSYNRTAGPVVVVSVTIQKIS